MCSRVGLVLFLDRFDSRKMELFFFVFRFSWIKSVLKKSTNPILLQICPKKSTPIQNTYYNLSMDNFFQTNPIYVFPIKFCILIFVQYFFDVLFCFKKTILRKSTVKFHRNFSNCFQTFLRCFTPATLLSLQQHW